MKPNTPMGLVTRPILQIIVHLYLLVLFLTFPWLKTPGTLANQKIF
ncbi:hypothetical protein [Cylindrospermopsis raciborskii]|nr:hypothetical protein [Cylindrospermopsis raciborskii]